MGDGGWGPDGELPDGPGKVDPRPEPAFPTNRDPKENAKNDRDEAAEDAMDEANGRNQDTGPSPGEIIGYIAIAGAIAAPFIGPLLPKAPASPPTTAPDKAPDKDAEPASPAPKSPGTTTPAQPAPATPKPDPVPVPSPKPAPDPETGKPPPKCWVAREVYGYNNPSWLLFRDYLDFSAPTWFKKFYISYGEKIAEFIKDKPFLKNLIKVWMDTKI